MSRNPRLVGLLSGLVVLLTMCAPLVTVAAAQEVLPAAPASFGPASLGTTASTAGNARSTTDSLSISPAGPAFQAAAPALQTMTITGHGRGHGRGMGQYGAFGYATIYGWSFQDILRHFYGGTNLTTPAPAAPKALITVRLTAQDDKELKVTASGVAFAVGGQFWFAPGESATLRLENGGLIGIYKGAGCEGVGTRIGAATNGVIAAATAAPGNDLGQMLTVCSTAGNRTYRGLLELTNTISGARTINTVYVDDYVRGVVPRESPASWADSAGGRGAAAIQAQTVAARSYALAESRYSYARTCDTDACQVYGGAGLAGSRIEDARTDAAAVITAGLALTWPNGTIVRAEFSSSSGGYTTTGAFPGVPDEGDAVSNNPYHNWSVVKDVSVLGSRYGIGTLTGMQVMSRDGVGADGGRATTVQLVGTAGSTSISGDAVRLALDLWSNWFVLSGEVSTGTVQAIDPGTRTGLAGVVMEIRDSTCTRTFSTMVTSPNGFQVTANPGVFCAVPLSAPNGYSAPAAMLFTVRSGESFLVTLTAFYVPQLGQLTAYYQGMRVPGAVFSIRDSSCTITYSTMVTNSLGSFFVQAFPGTYCAVPLAVPPGYAMPAAATFTVRAGEVYNVGVNLVDSAITGSLIAHSAGVPVPNVVFQIRNASCTTVFSQMQTGGDGRFAVTANPGTYCAVPVSVPPGFSVPANVVFTVTSGTSFEVRIAMPANPVSGQLQAASVGTPVPGITVAIRDATCSQTFSTMVTSASGTFAISAFPGRYCAVALSVPAGFAVPAPVLFTVSAGIPFEVALAVSPA